MFIQGVFLNRGNGGLTYEEAKSHFTAWALMKSPLLVSLTIFFFACMKCLVDTNIVVVFE